MRLDQIAAATVNQLLWRLLRRAIAAALMAFFAAIAIYHWTVAGTIGLETHYGALHARLIIAGIYTVLSLTALGAFFALRTKAAASTTPALDVPRQMQIAMLVEAVMLGYALARKGERAP